MVNENARQYGWTSSWLKLALFVFVFGGLGLMATACNKKYDAAGGAPVMYGPNGKYVMNPNVMCQGCPMNLTYLVSGVSQYFDMQFPGSPVELTLDFYGQGSVLGQMNGFQPGMYVPGQGSSYYGPVTAQGYLAVNPQNAPPVLQNELAQCGLPPGRFAVQTVQPGVFGNDSAGRSFENIMLTMTGGPIPFQIYVSGFTMPSTPQAMDSFGRAYPFRLTITTFRVQRADGYGFCNLPNIFQ